ncbi:MAG: cytidylate kinase-like family protein [Armatimonadetes bacterium]|nr:cytidylate kinase-like family protein [Armatimonadota bacterium]
MATVERFIEAMIDRQMRQREINLSRGARPAEPEQPGHAPLVTVSREHGSGGTEIARTVARQLGWHLLDRELVERMAKEAHVRHSLIETLDEKTQTNIDYWIKEFIGANFLAQSDYLKYLMRVLLAVGHHGEVVIVGRGANFVFPRQQGLHVRVIAPLERRVERIARLEGLSTRDARVAVQKADAERAAFVRLHFHRDINDPFAYDLIINTQGLPFQAAADGIAAAVPAKSGK